MARSRLSQVAGLLGVTVEASPTPTLITNAELRVVAMNEAARALLGRHVGAQRGRNVLRCRHVDLDVDGARAQEGACVACAIRAAVRRALEDGRLCGAESVLELYGEPSDAPVRAVLSASPIRWGGYELAVVTIEDASGDARQHGDSRRAEQALRASEERYRAIFEQAGVGMAHVDVASGRFLRVNDKLCAILGYARDEILALRWQDVTHEEDLASDMGDFVRMLAGDGPYSRQKRYVRKDGQSVWIHLTVAPLWAIHEAPTTYVSVIEDVTSRKEAEEELRRSEERFRAAFQTSPDAISITSVADGTYLAINESFTRMAGWREEDVLGRSSLDLGIWVDPEDRARLVAGLRADGVVRNLEAEFRCKDGRIFRGLMSARMVTLSGVASLLSVTRDITQWKRSQEEKKQLEELLRQAQKMEAIGQLAGGVAHDFNNLLTVILSNSEALQANLDGGGAASSTLRPLVEDIDAAAQRARDLTRQLLTFARRQVIAPVALDLNQAVRASEKLLRRLLGEDIELETTLQPDLWRVRCDPGQVEQVILNLAVNARDAMPGGGRLTIATANAALEAGSGRLAEGVPPGQYVRMGIRDSGHGMSPQVKARIFEPFFTTKGGGRGTGLGLATVYGIVKQSEGYIHVETEPGRGTTFDLYLPRTGATDAEVPAARPVGRNSTRGTESILVVEDDPLVREVTVSSLRAGGYRVLVAANGREALDVAAGQRELHLLVTDVVMPGVSGREVAQQLCARRPGLRVLYVSGYSEDVIAQRGVLEPGVDLLPKPFTASSLLERVRAVLEAR